MSDGVAVPVPWPPANSTSGTYPVIIVDEGTYIQRDLDSGTTNEASLIVRVEGLPDTVAAVGLAETAAVAAYPTHPSEGCLVLVSVGPVFGHNKLKGNSMVVDRAMTTDTDATLGTGTTGTVVLVKLLYKRQAYLQVSESGTVIIIRAGQGTDYGVSPTGNSASASLEVEVIGVASRQDAIDAAIAMYPTHPDDPTLPLIGKSARFVGLQNCGEDGQVWLVTLRYGKASLNTKFGRIGQGYHGLNYTANDRKVFYQNFRDANTDIDSVIAARASGTGPNGEPFEGYDVRVEKTETGGDVVDSTIRYAWPAFQSTAQTQSSTKYDNFPIIPGLSLRQVLATTLDTATNITGITSATAAKFHQLPFPLEELSVFWRSNTSAQATFASVAGKINDGAYSIAGRTFADATAVYTGADETDLGAAASPRYISTIKFLVYPDTVFTYRITITKDAVTNPTNPYYFTVSDPYSDAGSYATFPTPPTYIP